MNYKLISILFFIIIMSSCASKKIKNIPYLKTDTSTQNAPTLNVFKPKNSNTKNKVLLFVHGGNWNSGNKNMYSFIGRNFAKKGITTVVVGYTLSPKANYDSMAKEIAASIEWTKENIETYNGNPDEIYLTGHSAGGHLIALVGTNPKYLNDKSIIKGIILNDAAGLDMKNYLEENPPKTENDYIATWTENPENWKEASPIYFIDEKTPEMMIYLGSKTYESIKEGITNFVKELNKFQHDVKPIIINKRHAPMVLQYAFPWNNRIDEIINFINEE